MRFVLLLLWFLFIASASFWLPAYQGDIDREDTTMLVPVYAVLAGLAAIGIREQARSSREALVSALPVVGLLCVIAASGYLLKEPGKGERGAPIFLYYGVALCASWAVLMLATALVSRTKWNNVAGIGIGLLVALLALILVMAQVD
jgi:hypothetical protein